MTSITIAVKSATVLRAYTQWTVSVTEQKHFTNFTMAHARKLRSYGHYTTDRYSIIVILNAAMRRKLFPDEILFQDGWQRKLINGREAALSQIPSDDSSGQVGQSERLSC